MGCDYGHATRVLSGICEEATTPISIAVLLQRPGRHLSSTLLAPKYTGIKIKCPAGKCENTKTRNAPEGASEGLEKFIFMLFVLFFILICEILAIQIEQERIFI